MATGLRPAWFPRRGEVYWVKMDKFRPAIILSINELNRTRRDVCVVPVTSVPRKFFRLRVALPREACNLTQDSWAKCDQVTTVEKLDLRIPAIGAVPAATLEIIEQYVKLTLGLP